MAALTYLPKTRTLIKFKLEVSERKILINKKLNEALIVFIILHNFLIHYNTKYS